MSTATERTALYRLLAANGRLLYVGISNNPDFRWGTHSNKQPWWHEVADRKVEWFPDREAAAAAEVEAIREERPLYNKQHSPLDRREDLNRQATEIVSSLRYDGGQLANHAERFLLANAVATALADGWTKWEILAEFAVVPERKLPEPPSGIRWPIRYRERLLEAVTAAHTFRCGHCEVEREEATSAVGAEVVPWPSIMPDPGDPLPEGLDEGVAKLSNADIIRLTAKLFREHREWYEGQLRADGEMRPLDWSC